eukprot:s2448_g4.t1
MRIWDGCAWNKPLSPSRQTFTFSDAGKHYGGHLQPAARTVKLQGVVRSRTEANPVLCSVRWPHLWGLWFCQVLLGRVVDLMRLKDGSTGSSNRGGDVGEMAVSKNAAGIKRCSNAVA